MNIFYINVVNFIFFFKVKMRSFFVLRGYLVGENVWFVVYIFILVYDE